MWYLFRAGPNDGEGVYVASFPSIDAARRVVEDIASEGRKKLVVRQVDRLTFQFVVKDPATTLRSLASAVVYTASRDRRNPVMRPVSYSIGDRILNPGEKLPSPYLKVAP